MMRVAGTELNRVVLCYCLSVPEGDGEERAGGGHAGGQGAGGGHRRGSSQMDDDALVRSSGSFILYSDAA
jgi:hypothetical protein